ncbi:MAG: glycine cleavage system aminomethyltransferase GcvT [Gemmatimonadetes bacterium]|uniref:Aminomethyltransferase n=1 Tax=Candidatus Kutchimonas denitrificans TaxID=3056748 RepID=A0AAE4Z579_9BACT|nr:glycine cleavage system aminomethyltransferase GcvT [Gemmatimonadota bacterium]NIR73748.1 glycine cleavage system aminomethyltransferase GcvT [Candidatus Kutchimonas denitrificans]NIS03112.1 glycine cleavage system aminomethyltransferase GcvT [Gemmatimonadota bacterium]NIT69013.1 glycine cleavage system aminomethyltransferase GcvT [Gemmatimonadota bacterium]NIU54104.1 glycine cleavage system aminomethyltransferase GcvT [Gemmatimonadota bacterium]
MTELERTPLYDEHVALGAKLVPFAGFAMPVQYREGVAKEHQAVRESAGLFDVSHMGEFVVTGEAAEEFVNYLVASDVSRLAPGQAQYAVMCLENGGIVDDLLIYRFPDRFRLVVNAANIEKDFDWVESCLKGFGGSGVELVDESERIGLLALQGPVSEEIIDPLTELDASEIGYYRFAASRVAGEDCVLSRTGYTGEDGFEVYCAADVTPTVWRAILEAGGDRVMPVGLGARDTLRLEMGYALYGNDIDEETNPLEAGLGWTVKLDKGDFMGREALIKQKEEGLSRRLRGFVLKERGFPRPGYELSSGGEVVGEVRSGTFGPSVGVGIGTGYLPIDRAAFGAAIEVLIRGKGVPAEVVRMPFYKGGSLKR